MNLIVEIVDQRGTRIERVSISTNHTVTVGRAWDSDIIISDKYVDSKHLTIGLADANEGDVTKPLLISDCKTLNGIKIKGSVVHADSVRCGFGIPIRVGDSTVRIYDAAVSVKEAVPRSAWTAIPERFSQGVWLFVLTLVTFSLQLYFDWLGSASEFKLLVLLVNSVSVLTLIFCSALIFAGANKLLKGEGNFRVHWAVVCFALIFFELSYFLLRILMFNLQSKGLGQWLENGIYGVMIVGFCFVVLTLTSYFSDKSKLIASLVLAFVFLVGSQAQNLLKEDHELWNAASDTELATLPPTFLLRNRVDQERFLSDSQKLFEFEIDSLNTATTGD